MFTISECLYLGNSYQPSLMFVSKARDYPSVEQLKVLHSGRLLPYSQKVVMLERLGWDKHPSLIQTFVNRGSLLKEKAQYS